VTIVGRREEFWKVEGTHCQMDEGTGSEGTYNVSARYLRSAAVG